MLGGFPSLVPEGRHDSRPPFYLKRPVTLIGARRRAHIRLESEDVSRSHAVVLNVGGQVVIRDLASRTHVYVNGREVHEAVLQDGDHVNIGPFALRFVAGEETSDPEPVEAASVAAVTVLDGDGNDCATVSLDGTMCVVGSRDGVDLVLRGRAISFAHAVIYADGGRHVIHDLGSRTGTLVDGFATDGEVEIRAHSMIRIGDYQMRYSPVAGTTGFNNARPVAAPAEPLLQTLTNEDTWYPPKEKLTPKSKQAAVAAWQFQGRVMPAAASTTGADPVVQSRSVLGPNPFSRLAVEPVAEAFQAMEPNATRQQQAVSAVQSVAQPGTAAETAAGAHARGPLSAGGEPVGQRSTGIARVAVRKAEPAAPARPPRDVFAFHLADIVAARTAEVDSDASHSADAERDDERAEEETDARIDDEPEDFTEEREEDEAPPARDAIATLPAEAPSATTPAALEIDAILEAATRGEERELVDAAAPVDFDTDAEVATLVDIGTDEDGATLIDFDTDVYADLPEPEPEPGPELEPESAHAAAVDAAPPDPAPAYAADDARRPVPPPVAAPNRSARHYQRPQPTPQAWGVLATAVALAEIPQHGTAGLGSARALQEAGGGGRSRRKWALAAVVVLLVVIGGGYALFKADVYAALRVYW
jgi:pSer/pThr/pTyr-binding forkhead associated (FHA) protein